jgi:ribosomal-protein-alanine N-acetyltransferase
VTPDQLAALQARAYRDMAPWRVQDFDDLLSQKTTRLFTSEHAFLMARFIADEAEILALATDPGFQRQGQAAQVLAAFHESAVQNGITQVFLEVADSNVGACEFYISAGYKTVGKRKAYYLQTDGTRTDALLMSKATSATER